MNESKLINRLQEFVEDYGDMYVINTKDKEIVIKDGEGNLFTISINSKKVGEIKNG